MWRTFGGASCDEAVQRAEAIEDIPGKSVTTRLSSALHLADTEVGVGPVAACFQRIRTPVDDSSYHQGCSENSFRLHGFLYFKRASS